jgi:hypothetical protein
MSKKTRQRVPKYPFSQKENEIIREELTDQEAYRRNAGVLREMLKNMPEMHGILLDPFGINRYMTEITQRFEAERSLAQNHMQLDQVYSQAVASLAKNFDLFRLLGFFIPLAKEAKIKREKRALLWACGELMQAVQRKTASEDTLTVRTVVTASIERAGDILHHVSIFLSGQEPYHFSYQKVLNREINQEQVLQLIYQHCINLEPEFSHTIFYSAAESLDMIKRDTGVRFYRVIHFPLAAREKKQSRLILENQPQKSEQEQYEEEERYQRALLEQYKQDFWYWLDDDFKLELISQLKNAAFGAFESADSEIRLNALAFSVLRLGPLNLLAFDLYRRSGEQAEQINPQDELSFILDIKGSPEHPDFYLRYAEHLYNKGEWLGAYAVYERYLQFPETRNEEISQRMNELLEKNPFLQEIVREKSRRLQDTGEENKV